MVCQGEKTKPSQWVEFAASSMHANSMHYASVSLCVCAQVCILCHFAKGCVHTPRIGHWVFPFPHLQIINSQLFSAGDLVIMETCCTFRLGCLGMAFVVGIASAQHALLFVRTSLASLFFLFSSAARIQPTYNFFWRHEVGALLVHHHNLCIFSILEKFKTIITTCSPRAAHPNPDLQFPMSDITRFSPG